MFAQVIVGKTKDGAAMQATAERWNAELRPGAKGLVGVTSGVADDGTAFTIVRFDSEADAKANSDRPEQDRFWQEMSKHYDGEPTFYNCPEVDVFGRGGSDDAGFVQAMIYKPKDVGALREAAATFEKFMSERPDIIGGTTAFATDGTVIDTTYFTSEEAARAGEKQDLPAEIQAMMQSFGENAGDVRFIDIRDPHFS
jgi:hypothetical protein